MGEMIQDSASTEAHLGAARRAQRRLRTVQGGAVHAERLEPPRAALATAQLQAEEAERAEEDADDDAAYAAERLNDEVETTFELAEQSDRRNAGQRLQAELFPSGRFGEVTQANPRTERPALVGQILVRLRNLPADHPLRTQQEAPLAEAHGALQAANAAADQAEAAVTRAQLDVEDRQRDLRNAYATLYADVLKAYGKKGADRLFPTLRRTRKKSAAAAEAATVPA